ncbi:AMP-binding protein [Pseudohaliea sp.]|uniref:AMP-binding protein n=1 Tax=Pseudohaliea sp. TaxID=2740289 RepID=UPI0032EEB8E9
MSWNFCSAMEELSRSRIADRPALIHDDSAISYRVLGERIRAIGAWLQAMNVAPGSHVGHYMRNSNAYLEVFAGSGLVGCTHVNVNYRYRDEELGYLAEKLDITIWFYEREFAGQVEKLRSQLGAHALFIEIGEGDPVNSFAYPLCALYEFSGRQIEITASSDDVVIIATGGTTGLPKGTQWRQSDLWWKQDVCRTASLYPLKLKDNPASLAEHIENVCRVPQTGPIMPLCPLMHGTGLLVALLYLAQGTPIATLTQPRFDADRTLDAIQRLGVTGVVIVGDAFALPLLEAQDQRPAEDTLASLKFLITSGVALSAENKQRFRAHRPGLLIVDNLGSSEAVGYARATGEPGVFQPNPTTRILDEADRDVVPGSGVPGMVYSGGYVPIGYYNEPEKSAQTFVEIDGRRYVNTGDRCTVREDGCIEFLGRDSTVINTGGEKVFTAEVERVLTDHPGVLDALVLGIEDARFGSKVAAAVVPADGQKPGTLIEELARLSRERLADYKAPRVMLTVDAIARAPNGKPDYAAMRALFDSADVGP